MIGRFSGVVAASPDAAALIEGSSDRTHSRRDLLRQVEELSAAILAAGLKRRDLVAIQLPNSPEFIAAFLALTANDMVAVPIDRDAPETEVAAILSHFSIRGLIYQRDRKELAVSTRTVDPPTASPLEARLLKLTSGSTGKPKGIVTSEANLIADFENIVASMGIAPHDVNFGAIPFSHSYGFSNLVTPLILQGTPIVISNDYLPHAIIELCNRHRCTVLPAIPMVFDHLRTLPPGDGAFETIRVCISAGAPLGATTSRLFRERFGIAIHSFYGCSECGGITYDRAGAAAERTTVGEAMRGVTLELDDTRLRVRSGSVALGYLHDASTFTPFESGTFLTDDLVASAEGEIVLTGRASEMINISGKKVNPREVEAVIQMIEGIRHVKVYGEPAGARGEVVAAAVVADPDVTREQIRAFCRERLSIHKVPRIVKLIDSIPVDERGKIKRAALAQL